MIFFDSIMFLAHVFNFFLLHSLIIQRHEVPGAEPLSGWVASSWSVLLTGELCSPEFWGPASCTDGHLGLEGEQGIFNGIR